MDDSDAFERPSNPEVDTDSSLRAVIDGAWAESNAGDARSNRDPDDVVSPSAVVDRAWSDYSSPLSDRRSPGVDPATTRTGPGAIRALVRMLIQKHGRRRR